MFKDSSDSLPTRAEFSRGLGRSAMPLGLPLGRVRALTGLLLTPPLPFSATTLMCVRTQRRVWCWARRRRINNNRSHQVSPATSEHCSGVVTSLTARGHPQREHAGRFATEISICTHNIVGDPQNIVLGSRCPQCHRRPVHGTCSRPQVSCAHLWPHRTPPAQ